MRNKLSVSLFILIFLSIADTVFAANWVIGAQKFTSKTGSLNIGDSICEMLPGAILENLGTKLNREVTPDEKTERVIYKLETERNSLFLQLSSEYKKRDALVLQDYTERQLNQKIREAEKKIKELEKKLEDNLKSQKEIKAQSEIDMKLVEEGNYSLQTEKTELQKWLYLFKNMFVKDDDLISHELITFYNKETSALYKTNLEGGEELYVSPVFENEVVKAGINTLLTGTVISYGDYLSVSVDAYLYPGRKKIASVMEVGNIKELDYISSLLARKLIPAITNALPVKLQLKIEPSPAGCLVYIDDVLQNADNGEILMQSGIHNLQFVKEGFRTAGTTYNFEGNRKYQLEVMLEEEKNDFVYLQIKKPVDAEIFSNAESVIPLDAHYSKIKINGKPVLGQFIADDGKKLFYYIPQKLAYDNNVVKIKPKLKNTSDYIDKRRKWMYGSYSLLMVSLIPTFYTYGTAENVAGQFYLYRDSGDYDNAVAYLDKGLKWQKAYQITSGISIGCGVLLGVELVRYLLAANSVLPANVRKTDLIFSEDLLEKIEPPEIETSLEENALENSETEVIDIENIETETLAGEE